ASSEPARGGGRGGPPTSRGPAAPPARGRVRRGGGRRRRCPSRSSSPGTPVRTTLWPRRSAIACAACWWCRRRSSSSRGGRSGAARRSRSSSSVRTELPAGTVTFVFTDVAGSTRLLAELGAERYAGALAEHRRVVRAACARHGGVEVDTQGDAFFLAFASAAAAVGAARELTDALAEGPVRVRVGLHTGAALVTDEGYVGSDVHLA